MVQRTIFQIPENVGVMTELVGAVPDQWGGVGWINGILTPSPFSLERNEVANDTGFILSRFSTRSIIKGRYDSRGNKEMPCDWYAIMVERKLPAFVSFRNAGYSGSAISFGDAKNIASGYLKLGYRGVLNFISRDYDNHEFENPERCDLHFERWLGYKCKEKGHPEHPPAISLECNEEYGGKLEKLAPIISLCQSLKLPELNSASVC